MYSTSELVKVAIDFEANWSKTAHRINAHNSDSTFTIAFTDNANMKEVMVVSAPELHTIIPEYSRPYNHLTPLAIETIVICKITDSYIIKIYFKQDIPLHYHHEHWCSKDLTLEYTITEIGKNDGTNRHRCTYTHTPPSSPPYFGYSDEDDDEY